MLTEVHVIQCNILKHPEWLASRTGGGGGGGEGRLRKRGKKNREKGGEKDREKRDMPYM